MMKKSTSAPVVVIDCIRNCIRIHRNALHLLGNPDYIILMVNPANLTFAILPSIKLQIAHAVRWEKLCGKRCFELYSKPFIRQLCDVCPGWDGSEKLRMTGEYIQEENLVQFNLNQAAERRAPL